MSLLDVHLLLQLTELRGRGLQTDSYLLQLLVCRSHQVAAPVRRLTSVFQLKKNQEIQLKMDLVEKKKTSLCSSSSATLVL